MYLTGLDLKSRYYHITLSPATRHKSAITTIFAIYEFLKMPFILAQGLIILHSPYAKGVGTV